MMIATVKVTINAMLRLNPKRRKVTTKMAAKKKNDKYNILVVLVSG